MSNVISKLHFFYCGRGDTILINAEPDHWGLVDCNLTDTSSVDQRVREFITSKRQRENQLKKLDFVCLTHPDQDHYWGMRELLQDQFYEERPDGKEWRFAEFWDSGIPFKLLWAIADRLNAEAEKRLLRELYDFIMEAVDKGKVLHTPLGPSCELPLDFGDFYFLSLSPLRERLSRLDSRKAREIRQCSDEDFRVAVGETNHFSAVLVLLHKFIGTGVILGSDASIEVWNEALSVWRRYCERHKRPYRFQVVKVSHHGAEKNLAPELYRDFCEGSKTVAVLSVGANDPAHPAEKVLETLSQAGIQIVRTCWPRGKAQPLEKGLLLRNFGHPPSQTEPRIPLLNSHDWMDITGSVFDDGSVKVI